MSILKEALDSNCSIISVMGAHAGESVEVIFDRKTEDIKNIGRTFWLAISPEARPHQVQAICSHNPVYMIFIEPATKGGARPTTAGDTAHFYSTKKQEWYKLPKGLGEVTGNLKRNPAAMVFDMLTTSVNGKLDLWNYASFNCEQNPIKFILGRSTICAIKKDMSLHPEKMISHYREIVAVARLVEPFCVFLR